MSPSQPAKSQTETSQADNSQLHKKSPGPRKSSGKSRATRQAAAIAPAAAPDGPVVMAEGRFLRLLNDRGWEYVVRTNVSGVVAIVAQTNRGKLVLVEQFRPPLGKRVIELPAGLAGDVAGMEDEQIETAVLRELQEETGYSARKLTYLAEGASSAGLTNESIHFFLASGLKKVDEGGGDGSENIEVHEVPLDEVPVWLSAQVAQGKAVDAKLYAGLYFASRMAGQKSAASRKSATKK